MKNIGTLILLSVVLSACGSLEKKAALVGVGDDKQKLLSVMGPPDDRQAKGTKEAWQYCQTGAGFGYHDYRVFWIEDGRVTGVNSYKSGRAGSSCMTDIRPINWVEAPDRIIEIRQR